MFWLTPSRFQLWPDTGNPRGRASPGHRADSAPLHRPYGRDRWCPKLLQTRSCTSSHRPLGLARHSKLACTPVEAKRLSFNEGGRNCFNLFALYNVVPSLATMNPSPTQARPSIIASSYFAKPREKSFTPSFANLRIAICSARVNRPTNPIFPTPLTTHPGTKNEAIWYPATPSIRYASHGSVRPLRLSH